MDDRRKKGEFVGALGALLVHVAVTVFYTRLTLSASGAVVVFVGLACFYKIILESSGLQGVGV